MKKAAGSASFLLAVALTLTLGSCSTVRSTVPDARPSNISLAEARAESETTARRIARVVPGYADDLFSVNERGSTLGCGEIGVSWTIAFHVGVDASPDMDALFDALVLEFADELEYFVEAIKASTGDPRIIVTGPGGQSYMVEWFMGELDIDSASRCFVLVPERDGYQWEL
ncbi:hypothetical protein EDF38_1776 [Frigoribacterium sp. PhB160]|uniref:hypothetical protein n=1 Tax=Frigoribacterium sp. PhB160 TaxID=2485192 RepID=UPI000F9C9E09|nr:hypothetical protein [Frigoribacterium sp. PhB160]ROS62663.1 hypothetical protein EDF38_1776 [Frigoribacterium sp. PhB160]